MIGSSLSWTAASDSLSTRIATLRIGVSGHRVLTNSKLICASIQTVLQEIGRWFSNKPYSIEILSSLADGADRLVPQCLMRSSESDPRSSNTVVSFPASVELLPVLPMRDDVYCRSFLCDMGVKFHEQPCSPESPTVKEFRSLLSRSKPPVVAPLPEAALGGDPNQVFNLEGNRNQAYRWTGNYIVDHCDLLLVVWNGNKKSGSRPGSTASVVDYARQKRRSQVWIHSDSGAVEWHIEKDDLVGQYDLLGKYNEELKQIPVDRVSVEQRYLQLVNIADRFGFAKDSFPILRELVLPKLVQARTLAMLYQTRYYMWGTIGYFCAAFAVLTAATLSIGFDLKAGRPYLLEAGFIAVTAVCAWLLRCKDWQRKWIDYRYLAERLRATCFLHIAGVSFEPVEDHPDNIFEWLPSGWVALALKETRSALQPSQPDEKTFQDPNQVRALGGFLFHAWIDPQQLFYAGASRKNKVASERCERLSLFLLVVTFVIAVAYGIPPEWRWIGPIVNWIRSILEWFGEIPHVEAVGIPAFTSALAGFAIFRHFARNAERYESMSHFLWEVGVQMLAIAGLSGDVHQKPNLEVLRSLVRDADRAMSHEHEGWRTVFGVRLPGPG